MTGAERYLAKRLEDPEYREAYESAVQRLVDELIPFFDEPIHDVDCLECGSERPE